MKRCLLPLASGLALASAAQAEPPRVVTDIGPVQGLVASVMGDLGSPDVLVPAGASPHDHALSPSEARALQGAGLVVWVGPELSPGIARKIEAIAPDAPRLTLDEAEATRHLPTRDAVLFEDEEDDDHDHEGHDDHGHDDHDEHAHDDHDGHDHGPEDPHIWLSPANARAWLPLIADALAEADPENAATYSANAVSAAEAIAAAETSALETLAPVQDMRFVVFHDAYQYLEDAFGLHVLGAIRIGDATAPSPARLDALRDAITTSGAACVFAEPQFDPRLIAAVTEGSDLRVAELDPLGMSVKQGADFYPAFLTDLATRIATCAE